MKSERTKKTIQGTIWGFIEKIANILLPFLTTTIIIKKLGTEYLGLNSLFTSILQVLSLSELGFGAAVVFAMYKPIANDDYTNTGAILNYLKKMYRIIGIIILTIGILLLPFLDKLISGTIPENVNIYILYIIYLSNTVISYLLFAYKTSLLNAMQRNDLISKIGFITTTLLRVLQILALCLFSNFYIYAILIPLTTLLNNILISTIVNKKYKMYINKSVIDTETKKTIKSKIFPLVSTKIASILLSSADTLVISAFLGLTDVAKYNNYYYIINTLMGFLLVIYGAMQAGIGNLLVTDTKENIIKTFNKFCFINSWIVTVCTACLLCLYQNFIELWVGKELLLPIGMVILFSLYFYANSIQRIVVIYKDAAGIWKEDMVRCYLSCILNLVTNILTVRYIGLYGVIGSTVLANIIGLPWMGYILYKNVFKTSAKNFYYVEILNTIITFIICMISYLICNTLENSVIGLILKGIIAFSVSNVILYIVYRKNKDFTEAKNWVMSKIVKGRRIL